MTALSRSASASLLAAMLAACTGGTADDAAPAAEPGAETVAVRVAPVADTVLARPVSGAGTVAPKDEIALSFKVGGVVARVLVDEGDVVGAGRTLALLELREIDAVHAKARSAAAKAERDLVRAERLYRDSVVTLAQLQDAETAAEVARADLETAAFNRRYAVITAPAAGVVLARSAEPGETVSPGTPVLTLGSGARGTVVRVGLADRDAVLLRVGDPASARFDALPGRSFGGTVSQIAAAADAGTGTYLVEVSLPAGGGLAAGLVGQVEIRPGRGAPATLVPIEAVLEADGSEATVYALSADGRRAERRRVTVAFIDGARVAVASGLDDAESVVTDGAAYLDDRTPVRIAP